MSIFGRGVFITGQSGIGKSELALMLVDRGHQLIADDIIEFTEKRGHIIGSCPELSQDYLEVRGLGILNIRALFGKKAIAKNKPLRLIVELKTFTAQELAHVDRLHGMSQREMILSHEFPKVTLPVAPGRNLAILAETAVRNQKLIENGQDYAEQFQLKLRERLYTE